MAFYEYIYKLRFMMTCSLVIAGAFVLCFFITLAGPLDAQAKPSDQSSTQALAAASAYNGPNVVTGAAYSLGESMDSVAYTAFAGVYSFATVVVDGGTTAARSAQKGAAAVAVGAGRGVLTAGRGIASVALGVGRGAVNTTLLVGKGVANLAMFTGGVVGSGMGFVFGVPVSAIGYATNAPVLQSVVRPSMGEEVPIIDPGSPELLAVLAAMPKERPPLETTHVPNNSGPIWPINGRVTAAFGVPHMPFQRTHTGIDISSGQRSGVTPVKSFRAGKVIDTIHSRRGYGNHVIVDHGNGLTSLYAHLAKISVQVGQEVSTDSVLGYEGTTGMSTGTHLHFEIRVNGKVANPRQFIDGNP